MMIKAGSALFKAKCADCHKVEEDFTGPALKGITKRRSLIWIYRFVHGPAKMIAMNDPQSLRLAEQWKPTVMTAFADLDQLSIYAILTYIETKGGTQKVALPKFDKAAAACEDSCNRYMQAMRNISYLEDDLAKTPDEDFFTLKQNFPPLPIGSVYQGDTVQSAPDNRKYVIPPVVKAQVYTVQMETFGWVNIDMVASKNNVKYAELSVKPEGSYQTDLQVLLLIPKYKVSMHGGKGDDEKLYAFKETNGRIQLPIMNNVTSSHSRKITASLFSGRLHLCQLHNKPSRSL